MTKAKKRKAPRNKPETEPAEVKSAQRPTKEARRHGHYVVPETRGAVAVYTNLHQNIIGQMLQRRQITRTQAAAAYAFERTWGIVNGGVSPSRDSTVPSVGGIIHESDDYLDFIAKANGRLKLLLQRLGPRMYSLIVSTCCFGEVRLSDSNCKDIRKSLDLCAAVYGLREEA